MTSQELKGCGLCHTIVNEEECTVKEKKPYIDTELVDKFEIWLRDHLTSYLCQGEKGNLYAREEMYEKLKEDFSEIEELAKKKGLNND